MWTELIELDKNLFVLINQTWSHVSLDSLMIGVSNPYTWIPLYIVFFGLILKLKGKIGLVFLLGLIACFALSDSISSKILKPTVKRVRPCNVEELHARIPANKSVSFGFVSSHAANHMALAVFMFLVIGKQRKLRWVLIFWALLIAYSRVYLGVHYPGDVLAGGLLGAILGLLMFKLSEKLVNRIALSLS